MLKFFVEEVAIDEEGEGDDSEIGVVKVIEEHDEIPASSLSMGTRKTRVDGGGVLEEVVIDPEQIEALESLCSEHPFRVASDALVTTNAPPARGGSSICAALDANGNVRIVVYGGASGEGAAYGDVFSTGEDGAWQSHTLTVVQDPSSPVFQVKRCGHSATRLQHGSIPLILVLFGMNPETGETSNESAFLVPDFDKKVSQMIPFQPRGTPPRPRTQHSATVVNERTVVIYGGSSPSQGAFGDVHVLQFPPDLNVSPDGLAQFGSQAVWIPVRCGGHYPAAREMHTAVFFPGTTGNDFAFHAYGADRSAEGGKEMPLDEDYLHCNASRASECRAAGNRRFVAGDYRGAIQKYNEAIYYCGPDDLETLACKVYANRSACHLHLEEAPLALGDALSAVRSNPTWGKAYFREYQALAKLGRTLEAAAALQRAEENASTPSERVQFERTLRELKIVDNFDPESSPFSDAACLVVFGGRNRQGGVCDKLSVLNLETMAWQQPVGCPVRRCGHSASAIRVGRARWMHVFGGMDDSPRVYGTSLLLDLDGGGSWYQVNNKAGDDVEARFAHASCDGLSWGYGEMVVFGGVSPGRCFSDAHTLRVEGFEDEKPGDVSE